MTFEMADPGSVENLIAQVNAASLEFDRLTQERHNEGERKYGAGTWLGVDTLQHAMDEVLDLANYARFTYIRLRMLQQKLGTIQTDGTTERAQAGYDGDLNKIHKGGIPE